MTLEKMQAIRYYLNKEFPLARHDDEIDFDRYGHKFRIVTDGVVLLLSVSALFIAANDTSAMVRKLDGLDIACQLKKHPESTVIVRNSGVSIVARS